MPLKEATNSRSFPGHCKGILCGYFRQDLTSENKIWLFKFQLSVKFTIGSFIILIYVLYNFDSLRFMFNIHTLSLPLCLISQFELFFQTHPFYHSILAT